MNRERVRLVFVGACVLTQTLACSDDVTLQPSTTTDPSTTGDPSTGDTDGGGDGDGDGDGDGEPQAECGNGVVEDGEDCDDGNTIDTDYCTNACTNPCALRWVTEEPDVVLGAVSVSVPVVAIDGAGNLIAGNDRTNGQGGRDAWIGKLGPDGESLLWEATIASVAGDARVNGVAIGPNDAIYATGSWVSANGEDVWVARLAADTGAEVWIVEYDGAAEGSPDSGLDLAVASDGVVVTGTVREVEKDSDIWLRKFDFDGNTVWTTTHSGAPSATGFSLDTGARVAVDADDRVYAIGRVYVDHQTVDAVILSYSADGAGPNWAHTLAPNGAKYNYGVNGFALDGAGSLYAGVVDGSSASRPSWANKYDIETGAEIWSLSNVDIALSEDTARWVISSLGANAAGVVLAGWWEPSSGSQTWLVHIDGDGDPLCYAGYGAGPEAGDAAQWAYPGRLALTPAGDPVVSGMTFMGMGHDRWLGQFGRP